MRELSRLFFIWDCLGVPNIHLKFFYLKFKLIKWPCTKTRHPVPKEAQNDDKLRLNTNSVAELPPIYLVKNKLNRDARARTHHEFLFLSYHLHLKVLIVDELMWLGYLVYNLDNCAIKLTLRLTYVMIYGLEKLAVKGQ